jgi:hypothetical protein
MPIQRDVELRYAVRQAGTLLQDIQDFVGRNSNNEARVRFPRGFLRTASEHRKRLAFVGNSTLASNLAYSLMLSDLYRWLIFRTDLAGTARDMVVKAGLALGGGIAEAILVDYLAGDMGKRRKFKSRTARLVELEIISDDLQADLDWLWDMRCRQHIFNVPDWEYDFYEISQYNRAARTVSTLIATLNDTGALP